jgi:hypothetical protein
MSSDRDPARIRFEFSAADCTGGLLAVRNRAFQTSELRSDFLRKSRQFLAESTHKHQNQTHNI